MKLTVQSAQDAQNLLKAIQAKGKELGFADIGVSDINLSQQGQLHEAWLAQGFHGEMHYLQAHGNKRYRPELLVSGTLSVITARMNYLPPVSNQADSTNQTHIAQSVEQSAPDWREIEKQASSERAVVSVYARGRDYHKVLKQRLEMLAQWIDTQVEGFAYRVFTDSAPVLEVALAEKSSLGWKGKHTLLINRQAGSMFFLGEIYINIALPSTAHHQKSTNHCGSCTRCIDVCPTQAIVAPYTVDARKCISYLTIELHGAIPVELRKAIGNRIYGCDDCQLYCPWNKFAQPSACDDFKVRHQLDQQSLLQLWSWSEQDFLRHMEGSAIRRIGYERWQRNLAVGLGNVKTTSEKHQWIIKALREKRTWVTDMVREHIDWAIEQQEQHIKQADAQIHE